MSQAEKSPIQKYADRVQTMAASSLEDWLGRDRAQEAAGRLTNALRAAAVASPQIYHCNPADVALAVAMCARTGLMPGGVAPDVYLIPRRIYDKSQNKKVLTLQWQISARGLKKLAEREGWLLRSRLVFEGDEFAAHYGLREDLVHVPDWSKEPSWDRLTHAYVVATHRTTGEQAFIVMHKAQVQARRNMAQSDTFWGKWPLEMADKTVIAYAVKRGIVPFDETLAVVGDEDRVHIVEAPAQARQAPQLAAPKVAQSHQLPHDLHVPVEQLFRQQSQADQLVADLSADNPAGLVDLDDELQAEEPEAVEEDPVEAAKRAVVESVERREREAGRAITHRARDLEGLSRESSLSRLGAARLQSYSERLIALLDEADSEE